MTTSYDNVLLGTSGWSYKEWIGPFYTKEDKSMLRAYAKVFKTVEIDSTFYRYPTKGTVMGWTRYSPEGFVFNAKLPKLITHDKKLSLTEGVEGDLQKFMELMEPLYMGGKLGCILIQLPPRYDYRPREMEDFFKILPTNVRFAIEFRDLSWMRQETWGLLEKYKVAYTIVDEPLLPPEMHFTTDFAYFRWHGKGAKPWYNYRYRPKELEPWVPNVKRAAEKVEKVYGYLNNHYHGYAVENCLQILEMLGALTPEQKATKTKVDNYFKTATSIATPTLEAFAEPEEGSIESLLRHFMDIERLKRAKQIGDNELAISRETDSQVEATIREYHIVIDVQNRGILHDCADWNKSASNKRFCKHLGKLMLTLDKKRAMSILNQISAKKDEWQFKPYTQ